MGRVTDLSRHLRENPYIAGFTLPATVLFLGMVPVVMQTETDPVVLIRTVWFRPMVLIPALVSGGMMAIVTAYSPSSPRPILTYIGMCLCFALMLPVLLGTIAFVFFLVYLFTFNLEPLRLLLIALTNGVVYGLVGLLGGATVSYWVCWILMQARRFSITITLEED